MRSIISLCIQDFKRLLTNALFWVLTATLLIIILVVNFALPGEIKPESYKFLYYNIPGFELFAEAAGSEDDLFKAVQEGGNIGFIGGEDKITIVHPQLSEKTLNSIMLSISGATPVEMTVESIKGATKPIPFNKRMTPIFVCFEALITGFILGGALMLAEKEDGTVRALRIAPMGAFRYLTAKTLLFSLIGTLYSILICVFCIGLDIAWIPILLLGFFGTAIFTLIGLAYTTLFKDMSSWFFSMTLLLSINMLPIVSFTSPSFAPVWMKFIPSYPLLFTYEKALFGGGIDAAYSMGAVTLWLLCSYLVAHIMTEKIFLKGARNL